jgi:hypothetical protein
VQRKLSVRRDQLDPNSRGVSVSLRQRNLLQYDLMHRADLHQCDLHQRDLNQRREVLQCGLMHQRFSHKSNGRLRRSHKSKNRSVRLKDRQLHPVVAKAKVRNRKH